ncbi:MAG TPA: helix-turn-helix domain-containing protein [Longimicrobium sp.]|nr:helix-turn-helix domain-containing protein [Longimicrobium sp.]
MIATDVRTLGAIVRQRRKALDWSQDKLAVAAGVSRPWLSAFEAGKASVEIGLVFAVLHALGMHVNVTSSSASQAGVARRATAAPVSVRAVKPGRASVSKASHPPKSGAKAARAPASQAKTPRKAAGVDNGAGAAAKTSRNERPALTIGGKSISSARARGASAIKMIRPGSSRGKKK